MLQHQMLSCRRKDAYPSYQEAAGVIERWSHRGRLDRRSGLRAELYRCTACGGYHIGHQSVASSSAEVSLESILAAIEAESPSTVLAGVRFGFQFETATKAPQRRQAGTVKRQLVRAMQAPQASQLFAALAA